jgi:hypothetical protein
LASSSVAQTVIRLSRGSIFVHATGRILHAGRAVRSASVFARLLSPIDSPAADQAAIDVASDSAMSTVITGVVARLRRATADARLSRVWADVVPLAVAERVRLLACVALAAALTRVAFAAIARQVHADGAYAGWVVLAAAALGCAVWPEPVAAAWAGSTMANAFHRDAEEE